jgi:tRNA threonylcarbamoyladenosine biosynthesis protein TsaE
MPEIRMDINLEKINEVAANFLKRIGSYKQFAFYGEMGAGKTTFITALCQILKAVDLVSSPTFAIVNEYETLTGNGIFHFDFYRIKEPEELFDIGFEEYLASDHWCFIEWPEKAEELIPETFLKVRIELDESGYRTLIFNI